MKATRKIQRIPVNHPPLEEDMFHVCCISDTARGLGYNRILLSNPGKDSVVFVVHFDFYQLELET